MPELEGSAEGITTAVFFGAAGITAFVELSPIVGHCGHIINPIDEDGRTISKLSMPEGFNKQTNISYLPHPNDSFMNKDKGPDIPSGLHTLQQGSSIIKITFDETRDGVGRLIRPNRWS